MRATLSCAGRIALVLIAYSVLSLPAYGQETGAIVGVVKDPTGAVVPGAEVTVTNPATGLSRKVHSTAEGYFIIPDLPVGLSYTVLIVREGFKQYKKVGIRIDVAENVRVDAQLQVGAAAETIQVEASPVKVETTSQTLGETIERKRIIDLPLNGRNFLQLTTLQPGVVQGLQLSNNNTAPTPGGGTNSPSVNGLRPQSNNYLVDGANNNESFLGEAGYVPPPEALAEFRILTNSYSARYGRSGGSIVSVITQSGSNALHGSVFWFHRNDDLDARNFFSDEKSPLIRNQFGFSIGGPIQKDKTFAFGTYEGFRERRKSTITSDVPSLAERTGDFSALNPSPSSCAEPGAICDPLTGLPFPGNIIPPARIGPIGQTLASFYPLPNNPAQPRTITFQGNQPNDRDNVFIRVDHHFSDEHSLMGRYGFQEGETVNPAFSANFGGRIAFPDFRALNEFRMQNLSVSDTYVFSPTLINKARASYFRYSGKSFFPDEPFPTLRDFGFTNAVSQDDPRLALPQIFVAGLGDLGFSTSGPTDRAENTFQFANDISWIHGNHRFNFGGQITRIRHSVVSTQAFGILAGYFGIFTGNGFADLLLDRATFASQAAGTGDRDWRTFWTEVYFQDTYRIHPRFTLNFGLRYQLRTPWREERERRATFRPGQQSTVFPTAPTGQVFPGDPGITDTTVDLKTKNFAPRIGFAWDVFGTGQTSLRGGYGIFFETTSLFAVRQSVIAPPFLGIFTTFPSPSELADPFAANPIVLPSGLVPLQPPFQLTFLEEDWTQPYVQQWNLTLQHQLPADFLLQVAYVGTAARHLAGANNINRSRFIPGVDPVTGQPFTTPFNAQQRSPFPNFTLLLQLATEFNSSYNGLQVNVKKPFSYGLTMNASYTWSQTIDEFSRPGPFRATLNQTGGNVTTFNNNNLERGRALFDLRQRLVINALWEIPLMQDQVGFKGKMLGGWGITGIYTAREGFPFTVFNTANPSCVGFDFGLDRTNLVGDPTAGPSTLDQWFNTNAFAPPPLEPVCAATRGNAGRNILEGPGLQNLDVGIIKTTNVGERANVEFRVEFFNLPNHPNFDIPVNDFASPNFGKVLSTVPGNEREIQFALKINF